MTGESGARWTPVCRFDDLLAERGPAAIIGDVRAALLRTVEGAVYAIGNQDHRSVRAAIRITGAFVLAGGILGSRADAVTVASPLYKQVFDLRTGQCLDASDVVVPVYSVRNRGATMEVIV